MNAPCESCPVLIMCRNRLNFDEEPWRPGIFALAYVINCHELMDYLEDMDEHKADRLRILFGGR